MAQSFTTAEGTIIIPSATATWQVAINNSGLSTSGVIILVGEADAGPDYTLEETLNDNAFGPDQLSSVLTKYRSGNIVDAFRAAASPANDPNIVGSPSRIVIVKTNPSVKSAAELLKYSSVSASYRFLADKSYGKQGDLINYQVVAATTEVVPTTGAFTYIPTVTAANLEFRVNGGAAIAKTINANRTPTDFVSDVAGLAGVLATGGVAAVTIPVAVPGTITVAVNGNIVTLTSSVDWTTVPTAGDTMVIPAASAIKGAVADHNEGAYVVTSATARTIVATKLSDAGHAAAVGGIVSAPEVVAAPTAVVAGSLTVYSPVIISNEAGNPTDGMGKTLEIAQLTTGTDLFEYSAFVLGTTTKVSWISKVGVPYILTSGVEYSANLKVNRALDSIQEELIAGGEIALKLSYDGDTASVVINDTTMTITVTGGAGTSIGALNLTDYPTLADLAGFIDSKTGYSCSLGSAILGQLSPVCLDDGTFTFASCHSSATKPTVQALHQAAGRLKIDAYRFFRKVSQESVLGQLQDVAGNSGTVEQAASGLPAPTAALAYLTSGAKGFTTGATAILAIDACEKVRGNFLVPLFSRDYTLDLADGLTESGSTYAIDTVNAYCRTHVLKMSTLKKRRNRQAFLSKQDTFTNSKSASSNIASFRCSMTFQDCKNIASDGTTAQFQPWMNAVVAAGMQAAGFYRAIVAKYANISGALQAAADFDDQDDTAMENALLAGLLPMKRAENGGWKWVSDQTTYGKDSNFVFNSIQAVYVADLVAMTTATRMENAFVGQSVADVSASLALAFLEAIMGDFLKLKMISASDDAPRGFKNASIRISGTSMIVSVEIKLAGAIYFIPISFLVSQVQQTA